MIKKNYFLFLGFLFNCSIGLWSPEPIEWEIQEEIPIITESVKDISVYTRSDDSNEWEEIHGYVRRDYIENCIYLEFNTTSVKICGRNLNPLATSLDSNISSILFASLSWESLEGYRFTSKEKVFKMEKQYVNGIEYYVIILPIYRSGYIEYEPRDLYKDNSTRIIISNLINTEIDKDIKIASMNTNFVQGR
ncbi:MAG: hypothetical protein JJT78_01735 [Leptospira sp.]|nr:hypothetical protein [Leptospira sp.]